MRWWAGILLAWSGLAMALSSPVVQGEDTAQGFVHHFDEHSATVQFRFRMGGMFRLSGNVGSFEGRLVADPAHLETASIRVQLASGTIDIPLPGGRSRAQSPAYFDTEQFPKIVFQSSRIVAEDSRHLIIDGTLSMHGVDRPQTLRAVLEEPGEDGLVHHFMVTGKIARGDFGMVADRPLISDEIRLTIKGNWPEGVPPPSSPPSSDH